ncbi:hypothetical protein FSP39_003837 [Pinctada imbricata]|uniref:Uncharacterized protein n=1 Tax=Pinctada imbricata TaxID=66713 RepID=A0AA89BVM2_PINIB|nr:hypothetical protein FSP39_003837 [Pinctada imbricata]
MAPSPVEDISLLDLERSNKGASKQRRDQINNEIGTMRDLLPLPESSRQRLSQLQIMSLSCVFIRKCNILQKLFSSPLPPPTDPPCDFSQSLTGFILVTTRDGKLVYISENVTEYLGHSMVDMKTQGDSLFDIVDKRDHSTVRAQLLQGGSDVDPDLQVSFFCRMNMSRTLKRQAGFGDVKVMHVKGHFADVPGQEPGSEQQVFMALCTPLITPDVKESLIQNNTMVFKSVHKLDMNFIEVTQNGEYHLGKTSEELTSQSWYSFLHPEDIYEAREKHLQLIKSRHEMGCMMTVRMINTAGEIIWVNIVMHVRQGLLANSDDPVILCINQVVSEEEAYQFKIQGQLFALYASRTPDFFFGSAFCTPIPPGMDANLMTSQTSAMIPQPFFPRHFDSSQFGSQTASHFIQNQTSPVQPGLLKGGFEGRQGHTDTLKALKRKLQENFTQTTCKPMKIPRVMQNNNGRSGYSPVQESTPLPSSFETNSYRNVMNSMIGGMDHHVISSGPMKVMQAHSIAAALSPKDKSYLCDTLPAYVPAPVNMERTVKVLEQVVPDVTIPACYPTPEPSPVASPEPSKQKESTHSVHADIKLDPVLVAKHLCAIKQKQFHSKEMDVQPKKLLPSLDVTFVDSFFDEINNISLSREDEIRLLQSCCEETVAVKKEPIDDCVNPSPMIQPNFDLEEFLLTSRNIDSKRERGMGIKLEKPTDDQQVLSFDSHPSPTPSSPFSSTDDKMTCEDFPSFALTPESNFDSDPYEDVLGTECWDLESVTVDITMPTLTKQTTSMHSAASPADNELHQLKQLLSSWTPNEIKLAQLVRQYPQQNTGALKPKQQNTGALKPKQQNTGALKPKQQNTGALKPKQQNTGALKPKQQNTGALKPKQQNTGALKPKQQNTGALKPKQQNTGALKPKQQNTGALKPKQQNTGALKPKRQSRQAQQETERD